MDFVERIAPSEPEAAAEALRRVPAGVNSFVQAQVLAVATTLNPVSVRPLAQRARAWVRADASNSLLTERAGQFMAHMAAAGLTDEAFGIARALLATRWRAPAAGSSGRDRQRALEPHIGVYEYGQMLESHFPALVTAAL